MRVLDAFGTVSSSVTPVAISRRSSLCGGGQSQDGADRKFGEHLVKAGTRTVDRLKLDRFSVDFRSR